MSIKVGIYLFPDVEVLDLAGPYEVFTTASRVHGRQEGGPPPFEVFTIARKAGAVRARAGLQLVADHAFGQHPEVDLLIVPGGVVDAELCDPAVIAWLTATAAKAQITASVCTGAFLLAEAGLLAGKRATTHWEDQDDLRRRYPELTVVGDCRWVDEGRVVTSGGISAGIDMSLYLVGRLADQGLAARTARQMEYRSDAGSLQDDSCGSGPF